MLKLHSTPAAISSAPFLRLLPASRLTDPHVVRSDAAAAKLDRGALVTHFLLHLRQPSITHIHINITPESRILCGGTCFHKARTHSRDSPPRGHPSGQAFLGVGDLSSLGDLCHLRSPYPPFLHRISSLPLPLPRRILLPRTPSTTPGKKNPPNRHAGGENPAHPPFPIAQLKRYAFVEVEEGPRAGRGDSAV